MHQGRGGTRSAVSLATAPSVIRNASPIYELSVMPTIPRPRCIPPISFATCQHLPPPVAPALCSDVQVVKLLRVCNTRPLDVDVQIKSAVLNFSSTRTMW